MPVLYNPDSLFIATVQAADAGGDAGGGDDVGGEGAGDAEAGA